MSGRTIYQKLEVKKAQGGWLLAVCNSEVLSGYLCRNVKRCWKCKSGMPKRSELEKAILGKAIKR